ncbi:hypothetical protein LJC52_05770 [Bacteroidales bacterium OttesenSCG-928-A17]|nr:hypothetical protein [Bacteroidales bacterium OttesenSCG-928-A17]
MERKTNTHTVKYIKLGKKGILFMIIWFVVGGIVITKISSNRIKRLKDEYPLMNINTNINGIISNHFIDRATYVELMDDKNICVLFLRNSQYKRSSFGDFIQVGDSISKKAGSDTVYIFREGMEYYFVADPKHYWNWEGNEE